MIYRKLVTRLYNGYRKSMFYYRKNLFYGYFQLISKEKHNKGIKPNKTYPEINNRDKGWVEVRARQAYTFRSSHRRCSINKAVYKNFAIFTGKHMCWSPFL